MNVTMWDWLITTVAPQRAERYHPTPEAQAAFLRGFRQEIEVLREMARSTTGADAWNAACDARLDAGLARRAAASRPEDWDEANGCIDAVQMVCRWNGELADDDC
ncbi:hypothetical protein [Sulfobacillus thermosulfidooxidans]|uniref:hypothetical protein n=1 Tax=Sulfobacillus thermosulfidooxidans TaxID=28034 RepID=UPI0006B675FD|nr:hypothetical protein [Sulfobacillus thermosulfidooxidans]